MSTTSSLWQSIVSAVQTAYNVTIGSSGQQFYQIMQDMMPAGAILPFAGSTTPTGFLLCNGQSVSTTTYADLYSAIGYTYGGSGSSFNVPDLRGIFIRGAGTSGTLTNANGTAFSGTLGAYQNDKFQGHYHQTQVPSGSGSSSTWGLYFWSADRSTTLVVDSNASIIEPWTDGTNGASRTGAETNPANLSLNYIIAT